MPHWREMMDSKSKYVAAWDLKGKDVTLRIAKVSGEVIEDKLKGTKDRKPAIYFEPRPGSKEACKPLVCNVTNAKVITAIYGTADVSKWFGKLITLYPTTTTVGGELRDCVRVRPMMPRDEPAKASAQRDVDPADDVERLNDPSDEP